MQRNKQLLIFWILVFVILSGTISADSGVEVYLSPDTGTITSYSKTQFTLYVKNKNTYAIQKGVVYLGLYYCGNSYPANNAEIERKCSRVINRKADVTGLKSEQGFVGYKFKYSYDFQKPGKYAFYGIFYESTNQAGTTRLLHSINDYISYVKKFEVQSGKKVKIVDNPKISNVYEGSKKYLDLILKVKNEGSMALNRNFIIKVDYASTIHPKERSQSITLPKTIKKSLSGIKPGETREITFRVNMEGKSILYMGPYENQYKRIWITEYGQTIDFREL